MKKRAQLTLIIIIGLILVLSAVFFIYINYQKKIKLQQETPKNIEKLSSLNSYIEHCIDNTAKNAIIKLGKQGRLFPPIFIESSTKKITYFYYQGQGYFPESLAVLAQELSIYIKNNLDYCIDDFSLFYYEIEHDPDNIEIISRINKRDITVDVKYPVNAKMQETEMTLSEFSVTRRAGLYDIYELSKEIYKKTKQDPEWIDIEFLSRQPYKIRLIKAGEKTLIYEITDENMFEESYVYRFAMKYNG
ncbi:hypothetical protein GF327_02350 [Candidatus Woesearchaeota archaeon]|nr:hypothetical protein [Candidatus Woesearchaeota archaeon]